MMKLINNALDVPAYLIDLALYVSVGWFAFLQTTFAGDEAAKYIRAETLFWIKVVLGSLACIALNIKMYRSTSYADHLKEKQNEKIANVGSQSGATS